MALSQEAIQKILGIEERVYLTPEEMADKLNVTFYPHTSSAVSNEVYDFARRLKKVFMELKVNVVPYEMALTTLSLRYVIKRTFLILLNNTVAYLQRLLKLKAAKERIPLEILSYLKRRKKIKPGISVVALGESETGNLPIDHTMSFRESSIITITDMPSYIHTDTDFHTHFDTAMQLFSYNMTNIVIAVDKEKWILYNFNASHPIYLIEENLEYNILHALIPKIAAPIRPPRFKEFSIQIGAFDPLDTMHKPAVDDITGSGFLLERSGLYPPGKSVEELPFRNEFYKWIGKIHLDYRTGMSYGFLAKQLSTKLPKLLPLTDIKDGLGDAIKEDKDLFWLNERLYIVVRIPAGEFVIQVPEVWVMTQRSGADKTHFQPERDLIKMGLINGRMFLQTPKGSTMRAGYRPSFDTKVILAHAVGNAIVAAILKQYDQNHPFAVQLETEGMALCHWHGYLNKKHIPKGWHVHGADRPHVACSSPQSAIYALEGKLRVLLASLQVGEEYLGDVHIEPHHGTNLTFPSLYKFGEFLSQDKEISKLGNLYLSHYTF